MSQLTYLSPSTDAMYSSRDPTTPLTSPAAAAAAAPKAAPRTGGGRTSSLSESSLSNDEFKFFKRVKSNKNFKWASEGARWAAEGTKMMVRTSRSRIQAV